MRSNRFLTAANDGERILPPTDPHERMLFWIARGNAQLLEQGRDDLHWVCVNGHYSIQHKGDR